MRSLRNPRAVTGLWPLGLAPLLALATVGAALTVCRLPPASVVQTVPVGTMPGIATLDRGAERLLVSNDGDATVSVLDARDGHLVCTVPIAAPLLSAPQALAVDVPLHRAFVVTHDEGTNRSRVRVLDTRTVALAQTIRAGDGANAVAVDAHVGHVFVTNGDAHSVSMLDAATGTVLRTIAMDLAPEAVSVDEQTAHAFVVAQSVNPLGYSAAPGTVSVLDTRTGAVLRSVGAGDEPGPPVVDAQTGRAFVASQAANTVRVLDARSGAVVRLVSVGGSPTDLAMNVWHGRVFVVNALDGTLSMLDAANGHLLRTIQVGPHPSAVAVDERRNRLFVTAWGPTHEPGFPTGVGKVSVFDLRSGTLRRTIPVGVAPHDVVVDEQSGHAFVVNQGGLVYVPGGWAERWMERVRPWLPWLPQWASPAHRVPSSVSMLDLTTVP